MPCPVEHFGVQLAVQSFKNFWMHQIGHSAEGSLPRYEISAIELADATNELGDHCSELYDESGCSRSFV